MLRKGPSFVVALLSGALTALAFPKFNLSVLAWISLIPLFFILSRCRPKDAFGYGLAAGFSFYGLLLYWIPNVPYHYGGMPMGLSFIIFLLLALVLGCYWALFSLAFAVLKGPFPKLAFILAPFLWVAIEYLMTYALTGFPWGILGYSQSADIPFLQLACITGVYGLSLLLVLLQSSFVLALKLRKRTPFFAAMALLMIVHGVGWLSLGEIPPSEGSLTAAVVQGNLSSDIRWERLSLEETRKHFESYMELTRQAYATGARLMIWPEFSVPLCFSCPEGIYRDFSDDLFAFVRKNPSTLLLGTNERTNREGREEYTNSALSIQPDGSVVQYDKMHLVPFGEYTPFKKVFFFIEKITNSIGALAPGREFVLHRAGGLRFGSPICYEVIFPGLVRGFVKRGADFLVTITNDGWYGKASAPYQHFAMAVFRAVENRRCLLRAATTGVSGVIDPYGRVLARSQVMTRTILTGTVIPLRTMTFYTKHGDILARLSLTLGLAAFIMVLFKKARKRNSHGQHRHIV